MIPPQPMPQDQAWQLSRRLTPVDSFDPRQRRLGWRSFHAEGSLWVISLLWTTEEPVRYLGLNKTVKMAVPGQAFRVGEVGRPKWAQKREAGHAFKEVGFRTGFVKAVRGNQDREVVRD